MSLQVRIESSTVIKFLIFFSESKFQTGVEAGWERGWSVWVF